MSATVLDDFVRILNAVTDKPGIYEIYKVEDIRNFVTGFSIAIDVVQRNQENSIYQFMDGFRSFVNKKFKRHLKFKEDVDLYKLIRLFSGNDKHSLQSFEELFRDYLISISYNAGN